MFEGTNNGENNKVVVEKLTIQHRFKAMISLFIEAGYRLELPKRVK
jgi:hypothetical protein